MGEEWKEVSLGEITELVIDNRGKTPKKLGGEWSKNGYRALSAKNIKTGKIVRPDTIRYVDEALYRKWMKDEVRRGDIFITSEAPFGQAFFWNSDEKIVLSQRLFGIRIKDEYDARFVYYYMTTHDFQAALASRATGTTVFGLRQPELLKCTVRLPDLPTQRRVAAVLSALDAKIEVNARISANLEEQARAVFRARFPYGAADALPDGWRAVTLGDVASISKKIFNPLKEPATMLEHYSIPAFDESRFPVFELSTKIKSNKIIIDDTCFMISKLNPTKKRVWKPYCMTKNAVCSTEFIVYRAKNKAITDFLYSVIDSSAFSQFMCARVTGTTGSRQRTMPSDTLAFKLYMPPMKKIIEYQGIVSPMFEQMKCKAIESHCLASLRDLLLPRLMSGELDVSAVKA